MKVKCCAVIGLAVMAMACGSPAPEPLNVVILTLDTTRADHLGCYGYAPAHTPNLDAFARDRAVLFDQAITTIPLTLPSHTSIMTGTYPIYHGIHDNDGFLLDDRVTTLAEMLSAGGWATGAVLAAYPLDSQFNLNQGFDHYNDNFQEDWTRSEVESRGPLSFGFVERTADLVNAAAFRWLEENDEGPFLLWMHYFDPHQAYDPPPPYDSLFATSPYDGEIAYADECFGELIGFLEQRELLERTIVIVVGDHGEALNEHGEPTHATFVYDSTMRVPLLIAAPGEDFTPGTTVHRQVSTVDIVPTVLELLGLEAHDEIQGASRVAELTNPGSGTIGPTLVESHFNQYRFGWAPLRGLRNDEWKYILAPKPELYHLPTDPGERINVVLSQPEVADDLRAQLDAFAAEHASDQLDRSVATSLDPSVRANLVALGYLGGGGESERAEPFPSHDRLSQMDNPLDKVLTVKFVNTAHEMLRKRNFRIAADVARRGLEIDPGNFTLTLYLGQAQVGLGNIERAIPILEEAALKKPSDAVTHAFLGRLYLALGRLQEARESLELATDLERNRIEELELLGITYTAQGMADEAIKTFERALEIDDSAWSVHLALGSAQVEADLLMEARTSFQIALEHNPYSVTVLQRIGLFYLELGDADFSVRAFTQAVDLAPTDPSLRLQLARAMSFTDVNPDAIRSHLQEAIRLAPDAPTSATAREWLAQLAEGSLEPPDPPRDEPANKRSDLDQFHVEG